MTSNDLPLSNFGPFSKRYLGASIITAPEKGGQVVFPLAVGLKGGKKIGPLMETEPNGWTHLEASPDLRYFALRYRLSGLDAVYADSEYAAVNNDGFVCGVTLMNNTDEEQVFEIESGFVHEWTRPELSFKPPRGATHIQADDYIDIVTDNRVGIEGERACVRQMHFASNGKGLAGGLGENSGDKVFYRWNQQSPVEDGYLYIRYVKVTPGDTTWTLRFDDREFPLYFTESAKNYGSLSGWAFLVLAVGSVSEGEHQLSFEALEPESNLCLDCFVLVEGKHKTALWVVRVPESTVPLEFSQSGCRVFVKDRKTRGDGCFVLGAERPFLSIDDTTSDFILEETFPHHEVSLSPVNATVPSEDRIRIHSLRLCMELVVVAPKSSERVLLVVMHGAKVCEADERWTHFIETGNEKHLEQARQRYEEQDRFRIHDTKIGPRVRHLAASLLCSVHYPCWIKNRAICGAAPVKLAFSESCTWDAGLMALAQSEFSSERAVTNILQGLESDLSFLSTQVYAVWSLFQKEQEFATLERVYPNIKNAILYTGKSDILTLKILRTCAHIVGDLDGVPLFSRLITERTIPNNEGVNYGNNQVSLDQEWAVWKSLLDSGKTVLAESIARRALEVYSEENRSTGHSVLPLYCAYYSPGRVNTGFDAFVSERKNDDEGYPVYLKINDPFREPYDAGVILVLRPETRYRINGSVMETSHSGSLSFTVRLDREVAIHVTLDSVAFAVP